MSVQAVSRHRRPMLCVARLRGQSGCRWATESFSFSRIGRTPAQCEAQQPLSESDGQRLPAPSIAALCSSALREPCTHYVACRTRVARTRRLFKSLTAHHTFQPDHDVTHCLRLCAQLLAGCGALLRIRRSGLCQDLSE